MYTVTRRIEYICISSEHHRNIVQPRKSSASFKYVLNRSIPDVLNVRVLSATIPNSIYIIRNGYDRFIVNQSNTAIISTGNFFGPTQLQNMLQVASRSGGNQVNMLVTFNATTGTFIFTNTVAFTLYFPTGLSRMLGMTPNTVLTSTTESLAGSHVIFSRQPCYLTASLPTMYKIKIGELKQVLPDNGVVAMVLQNQSDYITFFNIVNKHAHDDRRFLSPLRLKAMQLDITDEHDRICDLNNLEVSFILEVSSAVDQPSV